MKIENVNVYGLENAVRVSKFPMAVDTTQCSDEITETTKKLGQAALGSGHDNFINGVIVQFDLTFSLKAWTELQRYHFIDFISSCSTMHRISQFPVREQCNEYVDERAIALLEEKIANYNNNKTPENYLRILYNIPTGFQLTAGMTTNYRQLKTIYYQRRNHRLPEWREFCKWIESLPHFKELCLAE